MPSSTPKFADYIEAKLRNAGDWLNLHRLLRSTCGVIKYVHRALDSGVSVKLGCEVDRYKALLDADLAACNSLTSFPSLPLYQLTGPEEENAALFEDLIERLADPKGATGWDAQQYLWIVEELDRVPPIARVRIGAKMREAFFAMHESKSRRSFITIDPINPTTRIAFTYEFDSSDSQDEDWFMAQTACYGVMRHQQAIDAGADASTKTLSIGVLHHPTLGRRYVFFYASESDLSLPQDLRRQMEEEFGMFDGATVRVTA